MSSYREKSRLRRIFTWKRVLVLVCFTAAIIMLISVSSPSSSNSNVPNWRRKILDGIAAKTKWDRETVEYFKRQLGLDNRPPSTDDRDPCPDYYWDKKEEYLIVTGFPGPNVTDLESQLWLYFNLLALEKTARPTSPIVRFMLPSKSKEILDKVFSGVQFGDLSRMFQCESQLKMDKLLTYSRVFGHFEDIERDEREPQNKKIQLIILNEGTKRLTELADYEFTFDSYRPKFIEELVRNVQRVVRKAMDLPPNDKSRDSGVGGGARVAVVPLNLIGVSVEERDYLPNLMERFKAAFEYHRTVNENSFFIVVCHPKHKEECLERFKAQDTIVTGFDNTAEERFALLSSCHGNVISNSLSFFAALLNNGQTSLVDSEWQKSHEGQSWLLWFAEKRDSWMIIEDEFIGS